MTSIARLGCGLVVLTALVATAAQPAPVPPDRVAQGRRLVQAKCAVCHAVGPQGASRDPVAPPFRDLNARFAGDKLDVAIRAGILEGHPMMPDFHLKTEETEAIIQYLKSIQTRQMG